MQLEGKGGRFIGKISAILCKLGLPIAINNYQCYYVQEQLDTFDTLKSESSFARAEVGDFKNHACLFYFSTLWI